MKMNVQLYNNQFDFINKQQQQQQQPYTQKKQRGKTDYS